MKVLEVFGDGDYCAVSYEEALGDGLVNPRELWQKVIDTDEIEIYNDGYYYFECEAYEFKDVDPKFIYFVQTVMDEEATKHHNFYVID